MRVYKINHESITNNVIEVKLLKKANQRGDAGALNCELNIQCMATFQLAFITLTLTTVAFSVSLDFELQSLTQVEMTIGPSL